MVSGETALGLVLLAKSGAVPWELPVPVWLAVVAFGLLVFASLSWLFSRPIERWYPPERRVRFRRDGWSAPESPAETWRVLTEAPLTGTIERNGHPAGTALAMPPKRHLTPAYRAYIAGPEWASRSRAFLFANPRCQLRYPGCTGRATQAHHRDYSELFHETARTLQAVCAGCHAQEEWRKVRTRR